MVNGALPFTIKVAGTEPTPMNTKNAVPMASAASFWTVVVSSSMSKLSCSSLRMTFDIVECDRKVPLCPLTQQDVSHTLCPPLSRSVASSGGATVIQSVDRAIRVLIALQGARRTSLAELPWSLERPPSTMHGIVRTLVAHGMVSQERGTSRYRLGPAGSDWATSTSTPSSCGLSDPRGRGPGPPHRAGGAQACCSSTTSS